MNRFSEEEPKRNKAASVLSYFGYLMVLVYLVLGTILLFTDLLLPNFPKQQRMVLGGLLAIYALYRAFAVYKRNNPPR